MMYIYWYTKTDKKKTENINQDRQDGQKFDILMENFWFSEHKSVTGGVARVWGKIQTDGFLAHTAKLYLSQSSCFSFIFQASFQCCFLDIVHILWSYLLSLSPCAVLWSTQSIFLESMLVENLIRRRRWLWKKSESVWKKRWKSLWE